MEIIVIVDSFFRKMIDNKIRKEKITIKNIEFNMNKPIIRPAI